MCAAIVIRLHNFVRRDSKSTTRRAPGLFSPVKPTVRAVRCAAESVSIGRWPAAELLAAVLCRCYVLPMSSTGHHIPEVTYVITALGCRLPFARVLCCRMS